MVPSVTDFIRRKPARTASLLLFGIFIVLALATFHRYGISNDEEVQQTYGEMLLRWYGSGFTDRTAFHYRNLYLYGGLFDLIAAGFDPYIPMPIYEWRHLLTAIVGIIGLFGVWRTTRLLSNEAWGCVAALLLALTGAWWGTLFNHTKDISFASTMIWVTYFMARIAPELPRPRARHIAGLGIALGCSLGLRIVAVYAGIEMVILLAFAALTARNGLAGFFRHIALSVFRLLPAGAIAFAIMAVSWPWAVFKPLNILVAIDTFRRFPIDIWTQIAGEKMKAVNVPRWYLPLYVLVREPELALIGIALGSVRAVFTTLQRRVDTLRWLRLLPVVLAVAVPIAHALLARPTLYNGLRHYMFVLPPIAVLAALGLRGAFLFLSERFGPLPARAFLAACGALALFHLGTLIELHPYESVAYNSLVGGTPGAVGHYEFDYHGNSIRAVAEELNRRMIAEEKNHTGDPFYGPPYKVAVCAEQIQADEYLGSLFKVTTNWLSADFFISPIQDGCEKALDGPVIITVERMGTVIGLAKDRREYSRGDKKDPP